MPVFGLDLGNSSIRCGIARGNGVDIMTNEASHRKTPAYVSFGEKKRSVGESGFAQRVRNIRNTVSKLKSVIGRPYDEVKDYINWNLGCRAEPCIGKSCVGTNFKVMGYDESITVNSTEATSMILEHAQHIVANNCNGAIIPACVVAIPASWGQTQRQELLAASAAVGLQPRLFAPDHLCAAFNWFIRRLSQVPEKEEEGTVALFIDVGESHMGASLVRFWKNNVQVLGYENTDKFSGEVIDQILYNSMIAKVVQKFGPDVENARTRRRLLDACEGGKRILSANSEARIHVECLANDMDFAHVLKRQDLEDLIVPILAEVTPQLINPLIERAKALKVNISSVEIYGGSSRVPAVQRAIAAAVGLEDESALSRSLNADECVALGATWLGALVDASYAGAIKQLKVHDAVRYPVTLDYTYTKSGETKHLPIMKAGDKCFRRTNPVSGIKCDQPLKLALRYADGVQHPRDAHTVLQEVEFTNKEVETGKIDLTIKMDHFGIVRISDVLTKKVVEVEKRVPEKVEYEEEVEVEVPDEDAEEPATNDTAPTVEEPATGAESPAPTTEAPATTIEEGEEKAEEEQKVEEAPAAKPKMKKVKKKVKKTKTEYKIVKKKETKKVSIQHKSTIAKQVSTTIINDYMRAIKQMNEKDRAATQLENLRNELESYMFELGDLIIGEGRPFIESDAKVDEFQNVINNVEMWIYDNEDTATSAELTEKYNELKAIGDPIRLAMNPPPPPPKEEEEEAKEGDSKSEENAEETPKESEGTPIEEESKPEDELD